MSPQHSSPKSTRWVSLAVLWMTFSFASGLQIFDGKQRDLFRNIEISNICNTALNRNVRCPGAAQFLTYPDHLLGWDTPQLTNFCSAECQRDLKGLAGGLGNSCKNERMQLQLGDISLADLGDFIDFRASQICLRESGSSGGFCLLASQDWDVAALDSSGQVTWPEHTNKCLPGDDEEDCLVDPEEDEEDAPSHVGYPEGMFKNTDRYEALDFVQNRTHALDAAKRSSLGWNKYLALDEFPLEIQCKPCYWKPLALAYESKWGLQVWNDLAAATWGNIVKNCKLSGDDAVVNPHRNVTSGNIDVPDEGEEQDPWEPAWDSCASTATVPQDNRESMRTWAANRNLSLACVQSFNKHTCKTALVTESLQPPSDFVAKSGGFSMHQFLSWNPCLNRGSDLRRNDSVCVGPPGGAYVPSVVPVETSATYTTTATPISTPPPMTIPNCGLYHNVSRTDTCARLSLTYGVTVRMLRNMNPTIDSECSNLEPGRSYCVAPVDGTEVPAVTTTFQPTPSTSTSTSTAPSSTVESATSKPATTQPSSPAPTREGTVDNCKTWHVVESGQECWQIQQEYDLTLVELRKMNTYIDPRCGNLWPDYAVCVGL